MAVGPGLAGAAIAALPPAALANAPIVPPLVELTSGNSLYRADLLRFSEQQAWRVDGVDTLFSDLYFLNLGNTPARRELRLEDLQPVAFSQPASDRFVATFSAFGANLNLSLNSVLLGQPVGSYRASRRDTLTLTNTGGDWLDLSLFKYIDYDLQFDGIVNNDTAFFAGNTLFQTDPSGALATLTTTQTPTAAQVSPYGSLLAQLYTAPATALQNSPGPLVNDDATAALQFDRRLAPGESAVFEFVMTVQRQVKTKAVPEPGTAFAVGVVAAGLALLRRRG